jgi:hypothetical protein
MHWNIPSGKYSKLLDDPALEIPVSHLQKVCKPAQGKHTCRYIALTAFSGQSRTEDTPLISHIVCVKNTPLKVLYDKEVSDNPNWLSKGNNCDGFCYGKKKQESCEDSKDSKENDSSPT